jgi:hypothetical protein
MLNLDHRKTYIHGVKAKPGPALSAVSDYSGLFGGVYFDREFYIITRNYYIKCRINKMVKLIQYFY